MVTYKFSFNQVNKAPCNDVNLNYCDLNAICTANNEFGNCVCKCDDYQELDESFGKNFFPGEKCTSKIYLF